MAPCVWRSRIHAHDCRAGWLTSGNNTVCHYKGNSDPPKNYSQWGELIGALGGHMVSKYGEETASEFLFEVWK
jgi:xylan 1,4-beta-xylosidase